MRIGVHTCAARIRLHVSRPSIPGSTSRTTTLWMLASTRQSASSPDRATSAAMFSLASPRRTVSAIRSSSSTSNTRMRRQACHGRGDRDVIPPVMTPRSPQRDEPDDPARPAAHGRLRGGHQRGQRAEAPSRERRARDRAGAGCADSSRPWGACGSARCHLPVMFGGDAGAAARGAHPGLRAWSCTGGDGGTRRHRRPGDTYSEDPQPSMSYLQAIVIALVQGVTELFPVSSLGHSVLVPAWIGGGWETLVTQSSQADSASSFYLAFIVALHCATALALLWFFRIDWIRIIGGFFRSLSRSVRERTLIVRTADERLAWLIVVATIPVGITGLAFEHVFRTVFAKPL